MAFHFALAKSMNLLCQPFVPTAILMMAENNDDVRVEVYHEIPGRDDIRKDRNDDDERVEVSLLLILILLILLILILLILIVLRIIMLIMAKIQN